MVTAQDTIKGTLDQYSLTRTLGSGFSAKVKLAHDASGKEFAIKMFDLGNEMNDKRQMELIKKEVDSTKQLDHPYICKNYEFQENRKLMKPNGNTKEVSYIVQDAVKGGELYSYVANSGIFSEDICRYFFRQMLKALHYLHTKGFAHRDLKPENILLTSQEYDIKIIDFGFATPTSGSDGSGFNKTQLGTPMFMAPEIISGSKYQGATVDLFALGVILFQMRSGFSPFDNLASKDDMYYKLIVNHRFDVYWKHQEKKVEKGHFSEDYKDLISSMLDFYPAKRLTMADLIAHPWVQGPVPTKEQVIEEFTRREKIVREEEEKERESKEAEKGATPRGSDGNRRGAVFDQKEYIRDGTYTEQEKQKVTEGRVIPLKMLAYDSQSGNNSVIFSKEPVENLAMVLFDILKESNLEISQKTWKMKFISENRIDVPNQKPLKERVQIVIELLDAGDRLVAIQFRRKAGSSLLFHQRVVDLKANFFSAFQPRNKD